jgi:ribosomal-protein-serine acetyltransferase
MSPDKNSFSELPRQLETARLSLRCPQAGDGMEFNAAVIETLPELQPWFEWAMEIPTVEDSEAYMQYVAGRVAVQKELTWLLFLKEKPPLIGVVTYGAR